MIEASHPLPDEHGTNAAQRMLNEIAKLTPDDLLLVLLSGGGSSLLALPVEGVSLEDLRAVTRDLLSCGAPIQDINTVRKHLSRFSGGRIAALSLAPISALIISDVVGNDLATIASGPCTPDPGTFVDALAILRQFNITVPHSIVEHLQLGINGLIEDTPKPGNGIFRNVQQSIIGSACQSLSAAEQYLISQGVHVINLGEVEGEAKVLAQSHADLLRQLLQNTQRPFALLSGGETTVTLQQTNGRGGRNTEYLLTLGLALGEIDNIWALACDTDGLDGTEDNAGAVWSPGLIQRATSKGVDACTTLQGHDAYHFFSATNSLVITGPTRTNVNDFRLVLAI
jgi:hydroxypyruvate reductase